MLLNVTLPSVMYAVVSVDRVCYLLLSHGLQNHNVIRLITHYRQLLVSTCISRYIGEEQGVEVTAWGLAF